MAITVGSVNIEIGGTTDKLQGAMNSSKSIVKSGVDSIQGAAQAVQGYLSMLGVGAFTSYIKGAIEAAGALADLQQKTGVSAEVLSGLEYAAKMSGTTLEGVAKGLQKLAVNMHDTAMGTGDARNAFKALGITVTDTQGNLRSVDDVMGDVADQFKTMDDGAQKTALAVKLFGKSGTELIPMLNEGSDGIAAMRQRAEELGLTISDKTASAMEALGDKFDTVGMASQGSARQIAANMTPALTTLADMFLDGTKKGGLFDAGVRVLGDTLRGLISIGISVTAAFNILGNVMGGIAAATVAFLSGNRAGASQIIDDMKASAVEIEAYYDDKLQKVWANQVEAQDKAGASSKRLTETRKEDVDAAKKQADKIAEVIARLNDEYKMLGMTAMQADIYKQQKTAGVAANSAAGQEIAKLVTKLDQEKDALKFAKEAAADAQKATEAYTSANAKSYDQIVDSIDKEKERVATLGMTKSQLAELSLAMAEKRMDDLRSNEGTEQDIAWQQARIDKYRELIGVLKNGEIADANIKSAKDAADAWSKASADIEKALTDALVRGFESGKDLVTSLRDYVSNAFKSMVVKLAVQPIMGAITGAIGMVTGNSAMAASGAVQQASGISNIMTTISTISTMAGAFGSSLAAGFTSTIASFGATTGLAIEGGMASIAAGTSTSIAAGLGQIIGTLGPYALAAVAVYALLGGFKGTYVKGQNVNSDYDENGNRTKRGVRQWDNVSDGGQKFDDFLGGIVNTYQKMSKALGIKSKALSLSFETNDSDGGKYGFAAFVAGKGQVLGVAETKITEGAIELTASRAVFAALQASEMPKYLAGIFDGLTATSMTQEQLNAAIQTASAYQALHVSLQSLPLQNLRDLSYQAAAGLVAAAGGMDVLLKGLQSFYDLYYTEAEKNAKGAAVIVAQLAAVGIDSKGLDTKAEFRALVESIDVSTTQGQKQLATLLEVAPQFASMTDYLKTQGIDLGALAAQAGPQLALIETTATASTSTATSAAATATAIEATTSAVTVGTTSVVGAITTMASTVTSAMTTAVNASTAALDRLEARMERLESNGRLNAAAP